MKQYIEEFERFKIITNPVLARLGHRAVTWELGPKPEISIQLIGKCKNCQIELRCQESLSIVQKKVCMNTEICVGKFLLAVIHPDGTVRMNDGHKDYICNFAIGFV